MKCVTIIFVLVAAACLAHAFPQPEQPPKCGAFEEFQSCGSDCEATCQNPEPRMCNFMCVPACRCQEGYMRSYPGGACVPRTTCLLRN